MVSKIYAGCRCTGPSPAPLTRLLGLHNLQGLIFLEVFRHHLDSRTVAPIPVRLEAVPCSKTFSQ
jgi:hypothetical protein